MELSIIQTTPDMDCFTTLGQEGAVRSNLAIGAIGTEAVDQYMNNVEDRELMFDIDLAQVGIGDTGTIDDENRSNALVLIDSNGDKVSNTSSVISLCPSEYFPYQLGSADMLWTIRTYNNWNIGTSSVQAYVNDSKVNTEIVHQTTKYIAFKVDYDFPRPDEEVELAVVFSVKTSPTSGTVIFYTIKSYDPFPLRVQCNSISITNGNEDINGDYFPSPTEDNVYVHNDTNVEIRYWNDTRWVIGDELAVNLHPNFERDWYVKQNDNTMELQDIGFVCDRITTTTTTTTSTTTTTKPVMFKIVKICPRLSVKEFVGKKKWLNGKHYKYGGTLNNRAYYYNEKSKAYLYYINGRWTLGKSLNMFTARSESDFHNSRLVPYGRYDWGKNQKDIKVRCKTKKTIDFPVKLD